MLLAWTAAVRLPFYGIGNGDEFFFSIVAGEWLRGGVPYVDAFDIKPPGIFFIYAVAQSVAGASYATFKGMEIAAVALAAWALFAMLRPYGNGRMALWSAVLLPVYTLAFDGTAAVNMLLQLPLTVACFAAVVVATSGDSSVGRRLSAAFLAGLAIGAAGTVKQTAIFEAAAAFVLIWTFGARETRSRALPLFVAGAALPVLAFSVYFLAVGYFGEMVDAVVWLAMERLNGDVVAGYGPEYAYYLTFIGALQNSALRSLPVIFLWGGAIFALLRRQEIRGFVPDRIMIIAWAWLAASFASAVYGRLICDYYLLGIVPPLLILAGAFFAYGMRVGPSRRDLAFVLSIVAATLTLAATQHRELFGRDPLAVDHTLTARAVDAFRELGMTPDDRLLVLNRGLELFSATGARPPSPYFHTTHLISAFKTPEPDPLGHALGANPRFVVLADPSVRHLMELPERLAQAETYLAAHYRVAAEVSGDWDSFTIYEYVR